jgi:DNA-binding transcriptional LysR family regulator
MGAEPRPVLLDASAAIESPEAGNSSGPAMDRLTSLCVLSQVVESGGFSAAGRRLHMSVTMVSNHIRALEDHLGVRLLNRTTRKVSLTEIGKAYYERSKQIIADLEEADRLAESLNATPRGTLRVFTNSHLIRFLLPMVSEYLSRNPGVAIDLSTGERVPDLIDEGFDLAIHTLPPRDSSVVVRRLTSWRHILCCAPSYLDRNSPPCQLADLARHNCLRYAYYRFGDEWRFDGPDGGVASVRVAGNVVSSNAELLRQLALDGHGIFLAPSFLMQDEISAGKLVRLLPAYRPVALSIEASYPHRHHLSSKVRAFIELLARRFAEHRRWADPALGETLCPPRQAAAAPERHAAHPR